MSVIETYPTLYIDQHGTEQTFLENNGKNLRVVIRGVEFSGLALDGLEPKENLTDDELKSFTIQLNSLCNCTFEYSVPIKIVAHENVLLGTLNVHLELGKPAANGGIDNEMLQLELDFADKKYISCGQHGWFEDEMLEIDAQLPKMTYMKCCFGCMFSDYNPSGSGLFGSMACFRNAKEEYLQLKDKFDLFRLWDQKAEIVQETFLCPEFEERKPGTGYRG